MVKDNHLAAGGATAGERLTSLVRRAQTERPDLLVEVEVDRLDQLLAGCAFFEGNLGYGFSADPPLAGRGAA